MDDRMLADVRRGLLEDDGLARWARGHGVLLGHEGLDRAAEAVRSELSGAGPLQALVDEPGVTDVLVNGPTEVWVDRGEGLERRAVDLGGPERLRSLAVRLAASGGQRLDDACPVADACLRDGVRVHAVLPPIADTVLLSLRVPRSEPFSLGGLVAARGVHRDLAPVLVGLMRGRANGLVTGATGTGKTTLLAALLGLAAPHERLVCVEEVPELEPAHPHVVRLVVRRANVEGAGGVGLVDLVRHALRMRPDRIVLGECRGAEVREVLAALNTGHDGGWATLHANAPADVPARLAALGALAGLTGTALVAQASGALDVVVHLRRDGGLRRVAEVGLLRHDLERIWVENAAVADPHGGLSPGPAWAELHRRWPAP
ncbi:TadA family conjugal transfer-associated ATPase [Actinotalea sp. M2MS4P-6]|uniref:TadA family conjugal transfer-associated ATPase n=1 Tax=Actinotalea sp. M2MS4P-6 TaxID=2983762 RepID=UPI0021E44DDB|nr:TadA family conjugal transfer-associated ATPase [Actinotalea sp. M2MS4P-6]MCV2394901.1 TadA family conjugal transfer-associated ATPase [Actinotalea sp. M2MS4P-6]